MSEQIQGKIDLVASSLYQRLKALDEDVINSILLELDSDIQKYSEFYLYCLSNQKIYKANCKTLKKLKSELDVLIAIRRFILAASILNMQDEPQTNTASIEYLHTGAIITLQQGGQFIITGKISNIVIQ